MLETLPLPLRAFLAASRPDCMQCWSSDIPYSFIRQQVNQALNVWMSDPFRHPVLERGLFRTRGTNRSVLHLHLYNIFSCGGAARVPAPLGASDDATAHWQFLDDVKDQSHLWLTNNRWRLGTCVLVGLLDRKTISVSTTAPHSSPILTDGTCPETSHRLEGMSRLTYHLSIGFCLPAFARACAGRALGFRDRSLRRCVEGPASLRTRIRGLRIPQPFRSVHAVIVKVLRPGYLIGTQCDILLRSRLRCVTARNQLYLVQLLSWSGEAGPTERSSTFFRLSATRTGPRI
ncbi:hypothetical protein N7524_011637 [Penicillium chrysogenum]|nr:hypothetical protein N7524_011637 [Penicillium chrysogenum]